VALAFAASIEASAGSLYVTYMTATSHGQGFIDTCNISEVGPLGLIKR
jgi:hypothetical protein